MAEIVAAVASTHTPGLLGWFEDAPEHQQQTALPSFKKMRGHLDSAKPDVFIIFANDHLERERGLTRPTCSAPSVWI